MWKKLSYHELIINIILFTINVIDPQGLNIINKIKNKMHSNN